jgi:hypothetical protein
MGFDTTDLGVYLGRIRVIRGKNLPYSLRFLSINKSRVEVL